MADTTFRNVINGELVDSASGETYDVVDPTTGRGVRDGAACRAPRTSTGPTGPPTRRSRPGATPRRRSASALLQIADAIEARPSEIVDVESRDTGKPIGLTMTRRCRRLDQIRFFAGAARVLEGKSAGEYMEDHTSYVRREPIGVVGQVTPWNYPLMMMVWKIAPALAAGNMHRPQAERHHAGVLDAAGRARRGVPAAGRAQRGLR